MRDSSARVAGEPVDAIGPMRARNGAIFCPVCGGALGRAATCTREPIAFLNGELREPVPYGRERFAEAPGTQCDECGVRQGGTHHAGCGLEECPRCGDLILGCRCRIPLGPRHPFAD